MPYLNEGFSSKKKVVAIGKFDGVHEGHKKLLITASRLADKAGLVSVAFIINNDSGKMLLSPDRRQKAITNLGIDFCQVQPLSQDFMSMTAEEFADKVLVAGLNCAHVVVGYNFRFAKGRSADADDLKALCDKRGISCTVIPKVTCKASDGNIITASSSNVRTALSQGKVKDAALILGRPYSLTGEVVSGKQIGRTIDIPTANVGYDKNAVLPKTGVYAADVYIDGKKYTSLTNIGDNPTVNTDGRLTVESNILDFSGDIYGKIVTVEFIDRIRDEKKFNSLDDLKEQIQKDIEFVLKNNHE